jgi:hypothetical protein
LNFSIKLAERSEASRQKSKFKIFRDAQPFTVKLDN